MSGAILARCCVGPGQTRLEPFSYRIRDLVDIIDLAHTVPDDASRLASKPPHGISRFKKRKGIVKPEQFNERAAISVRIEVPGAKLRQNKAGWCQLRKQDFPPVRNYVAGITHVSFTSDQRCPIEDGAVDPHLMRESPQAVAIGLDLVSMQRVSHEGYVNPNIPTAQPQFFQQGNVVIIDVRLS